MPAVASTLTIDVPLTGDADADAIRATMRENRQIHPKLEEEIRRTVEAQTTIFLTERDLGEVDLDVSVELVDDRVAGAPRERLLGRLHFEGDKSAIAKVDDAMDPPSRATLADKVESLILDYLGRHDLADNADVIVSLTPVAFE